MFNNDITLFFWQLLIKKLSKFSTTQLITVLAVNLKKTRVSLFS